MAPGSRRPWHIKGDIPASEPYTNPVQSRSVIYWGHTRGVSDSGSLLPVSPQPHDNLLRPVFPKAWHTECPVPVSASYKRRTHRSVFS